MAKCIIKVTLRSITHRGANIGDDWSFRVNVNGRRAFWPERSGRGRAGRNDLPAPRTWTITGVCGRAKWLRIEARAREHDLFFDDVGRATKNRLVECPGRPNTGYGFNEKVDVDVSELFLGNHTVTFKFRVEVVCR